MAQILLLRVNWDGTALPLRQAAHFYNLAVEPSDEYPFGRKGLCLANAWRQLSNPQIAGMLLLDGDVAIDPFDHATMLAAVHIEPDVVHTAPVKIWPTSTKKAEWTWGHWSSQASQELELEDVRWFSFCYTYLPRRLIEQAVKDGLVNWTYPAVDSKMSRTCQRMKLRVNVVLGCWPKHLNYLQPCYNHCRRCTWTSAALP